MKPLNELAKEVHAANIKWWQDINTGLPIERNKGELLMLVVTELAEAMEGERKGLMDDKLPHRKMAEVEMADAFIRLLDFAGGFGYELSEWVSTLGMRNKGTMLIYIVETVASMGVRVDDCSQKRIEDGLSIAIAQIIRYCQNFGYDLEGAYNEKMAFNATRKDHTHEARKLQGGKKF